MSIQKIISLFIILSLFSTLFINGCLINNPVDNLIHSEDEQISNSTEERPTDNGTTENIPETDYIDMSDETATLIKKNMDILAADFAGDEHEVVAAHPDEFDQIVKLGEKALPYLDNIIKNTDDYSCKVMAKHVENVIKPELYDLSFNSPNGKYIFKASVLRFFGFSGTWAGIDYHDIRIIDNTTGKDIYNQIPNYVFNNITVEWSPDDLYCAITHGDYHYLVETYIFDIKNAVYITLPDINEIILMVKKDVPSLIENDWPSSYFSSFYEWIDQNKIKIKIFLRYGSADFGITFSGWYIYDLTEKEILEYDYDVGSYGERD